MGRRLNQVDMAAARHATEVDNSRRKPTRNVVPEAERIIRTEHVVCGCGAEGCIFISHRRSEKSK